MPIAKPSICWWNTCGLQITGCLKSSYDVHLQRGSVAKPVETKIKTKVSFISRTLFAQRTASMNKVGTLKKLSNVFKFECIPNIPKTFNVDSFSWQIAFKLSNNFRFFSYWNCSSKSKTKQR